METNTNTESVEHSAVERLIDLRRQLLDEDWMTPDCHHSGSIKLAISELERLQADNGRLRGALRELLEMGELFIPAKLDAPGFKRARQALSVEGGG